MEKEKEELVPATVTADEVNHEDFILSQDLFCTPDYLTPENQFPLKGFHSSIDMEEEDGPCPKSPEKPSTSKTKRRRMDDGISGDTLSSTSSGDDQAVVELGKDFVGDEVEYKPRARSYVSRSAFALRCRVMPPACIGNSFRRSISEEELSLFRRQNSKCADLFPSFTHGNGLSRYHSDFHEFERIGTGNFSNVYKVLKRLDGCLYAVKRTIKKLGRERERMRAYTEVQAMAAIGFHENIVGYYSSWSDNGQLYIQLELCDHSLSTKNCPALLTERHEIEALYQVACALQFIHEKGIAHLDVKPENIYVKNGVYKLGDFGCATLLDNSILIEEGDARYMPQEIFNENYDHLDKVDIFSLGVSMFELIRRSRLPESETQFSNLKAGNIPHLPGVTMQFQNLLKVMMDPDPLKRPSATEILGNSIFRGLQREFPLSAPPSTTPSTPSTAWTLSICSCTTYAYDNNRCSIWVGNLLNVQQLSSDDSSGETLYLKLAASKIHADKSSKGTIIGVVVGVVVGGGVLLAILWSRKRMLVSRKVADGSLVTYGYRDLQDATRNWEDEGLVLFSKERWMIPV
ncbi:hypothetical protein VNO80_30713 [Phaseolus coccineus]|uniref:Protein kinase domain-containing protein n=1 Tax=Phaseolus coccineus TaxID=3886 RepID=A0AAN9QG13_PHACN